MLRYIDLIISPVITVGLFVIWIGLIVRRHRMLGPAAPLHDRRWFLDVYRRGGGILLRCRWLLWLPLVGVAVAFAEGRIVNFLVLKRNPELQELYTHYRQNEGIINFLKTLFSSLPRNFLSSADAVTDAALSPLFRSHFFMTLFLFYTMVILLKPRSLGGNPEDLDMRKRRMLGIISGVAATILPLYVWLVIIQEPSISLWGYLPIMIFYSLIPAFGFATIVSAIVTADREEGESFQEAVSMGVRYFQSLFLFFFFTAVLSFILGLRILFLYTCSNMMEAFHQATVFVGDAFFIMISFIPLLVVIQKASLKKALDSCIELWATEWKNLLAFIAIGALLLLIPVAMESRVQVLPSGGVLIGSGGIFGWLVQLLKVVLGTLTLSSFVVFLKTLQEKSSNAT